MDVVRELRRLGFRANTFGEVIVVFFHTHSSSIFTVPLGLKLIAEGLKARVYPGTRTRKVLELESFDRCCICITTDPLLFYRATLYRERLRYKTIRANDGEYLCLRQCDAYILCRIVKRYTSRRFLYLVLKPIKLVYSRHRPRVVTRATLAVLEALIYLTKIPYVNAATREHYLSMMHMLMEIVKRCTTSKAIRIAMQDILQRAQKLGNE